MNRHFEDTLYYLKRAARTARTGVREELAPVESTARELTGRERDPEPGRVESVRADLRSLRERARREVATALGRAREVAGRFRGRDARSQ